MRLIWDSLKSLLFRRRERLKWNLRASERARSIFNPIRFVDKKNPNERREESTKTNLGQTIIDLCTGMSVSLFHRSLCLSTKLVEILSDVFQYRRSNAIWAASATTQHLRDTDQIDHGQFSSWISIGRWWDCLAVDLKRVCHSRRDLLCFLFLKACWKHEKRSLNIYQVTDKYIMKLKWVKFFSFSQINIIGHSFVFSQYLESFKMGKNDEFHTKLMKNSHRWMMTLVEQ
jgi:hypothetical protein